ncbi:MAG: hydrogenase iron-sulfur subunit [Desulfofustis sp.]|nr:hydrogenase iron-sulfur subunit [Desulfofustis sp.]NNF45956.1 hydrogenase iron-sulfur subunit [Desulfofustis sp.]NNK55721.1 hydrogenase iron-sulfur subunit [Desulfofustis sp.]
MEGNTNAAKRVEQTKRRLLTVGVSPERVQFFNLSAAQGPRWAEICTEFSEKITELGPSPIWMALKSKKGAAQPQEDISEVAEK